MSMNSLYNTASSYTPNAIEYPGNLIPFVDKHINYLSAHPNLEASKYIANRKLMTLNIYRLMLPMLYLPFNIWGYTYCIPVIIIESWPF